MKRMGTTLLLIGAAAAALSGGCTTLQSAEREAREARERALVQNLRADVQRLQERVDGMASAHEQLYREVEAVRQAMDAQQKAMDSRVAGFSAQVAESASARESMREQIVETISKRMADLMRRQAPPAGRPAERGYEHVVKKGETLSEIAKAYGASVNAIMQANGLKNDLIQVGQKLFIPE